MIIICLLILLLIIKKVMNPILALNVIFNKNNITKSDNDKEYQIVHYIGIPESEKRPAVVSEMSRWE